MLGQGTLTTTAWGSQGELWDSEEDTCARLQEVEEVEVVERLMRKTQERARAM